MEIKAGDTLTINCEIISSSGMILFNKGDKIEIDVVFKKKAFWGKMTGIYYPEEITGIKIVDYYGSWSLEIFKETQKNPKIIREVLVEKFKKMSKVNY